LTSSHYDESGRPLRSIIGNGIEHEEEADIGQEAVPDFVIEAMRFGDGTPP
jgi:hypothetical protein